ncbi:MAG: hypothetical protein JXA25_05380 [Anaerolineales bacterium]|nr:hypothetical protein [Anaerolineales bacterium]
MKALRVIACIAAALLLIYVLLNESRRRNVKNLISQIPDLIPRYFV